MTGPKNLTPKSDSSLEAALPRAVHPGEEQARRVKLKAALGGLLTLALGFSFWAGVRLRSSLAPAQGRGVAQSSIADPNTDSLLRGRSPTGKPISPKLQSIADMAEFLEEQEQD
jgi:hypothetical protein